MKRFVYLFQVPRDLPPSLEEAASADSDIVFLSWQEKSADPRSIHYPSSSWTQGRNRLLKEVMGRPYHYFIIGDGDVRLELTRLGRAARPSEQNPWRVFERFLIEREPAIGCTSYDWHLVGGARDESEECQTLRYFDAMLNAFHHEALPVLLPYCDLLDETSECYSQSLLCSLAADLYPGHVMQTNRLRAVNSHYRGYPELLLSRPDQFYLESRRHPDRPRPFQRQTIGDAARHPTMGPPLPKRGSYGRTDGELSQHFQLEHPFWTRRRELAELPADADFFSSDPGSARAQQWRTKRVPGTPPPPPSPVIQRLKAGGTRRVCELLRRIRARIFRMRREWVRRPTALARWQKWSGQPDLHFEIPERKQIEVIELLAGALNELSTDRVAYIDVGAGCGDVLELVCRSGLRKALFSIGVDPIDLRAHRNYSGFVLGAISCGPEGYAEFFRYSSSDCSSLKRLDPASVSHDRAEIGRGKYFTPAMVEELEAILQVPTYRLDTLIRQFGLADEVLHFVKIDAQGSDLDVFLSLGELTRNCLFLSLETVMPGVGAPTRRLYKGQTTWAEDRVAIEAAGFRLLNVSHFGITPEADATFVNLKLFRELLPGLAKGSAAFR